MYEDDSSGLAALRVCIDAARVHPQIKPVRRASATLDALIEENRRLRFVVTAAVRWNDATRADDPAIADLTQAVESFLRSQGVIK